MFDRLKAGEAYDEDAWQTWENLHYHWQGALADWINHGRFYAPKVDERITDLPESKFRGNWAVADNQFPNAEANRQFKRFRIIQTQWEEVAPEVASGIGMVAFSGLTEEEVRYVPAS